MRIPSTRARDSTLITWAPRLASGRVASVPAIIHVKSSTRIPASGRTVLPSPLPRGVFLKGVFPDGVFTAAPVLCQV